MEYQEAWRLQSYLVAARRHGGLDTNVVLLLEHLPVFTLGRRGGLNNMTVTEDFLGEKGISVIQVERGGNITFHGPGQLVMYPIIDLQGARLSVVDYVGKLEEVMMRTAQDWGIEAERGALNRGAWVGNRKLGSVGIAIRRGICFHGAALNVNVSLKPFGWIRPCGLQDVRMTSMEQELSQRVSMNHVRETAKHYLGVVFGAGLATTSPLQLQSILATDPYGHTQAFPLRTSQGKNSHC
jgi:lipoate-protein ligase B